MLLWKFEMKIKRILPLQTKLLILLIYDVLFIRVVRQLCVKCLITMTFYKTPTHISRAVQTLGPTKTVNHRREWFPQTVSLYCNLFNMFVHNHNLFANKYIWFIRLRYINTIKLKLHKRSTLYFVHGIERIVY